MKQISSEERDSIARYQDAKRNLPLCETAARLTPADFDISAYSEFAQDRLAALDCYLKELKPYAQTLIRAAKLRQEHYEHYIVQKRVEERGHRAWREEMNKLADECQSLLTYWQEQRDLEFDHVIAFDNAISQKRIIIPIDLMVKNVEYDPKEKPNKQTINRPRLPNVEKKRRKKEIQQRKRDAETMIQTLTQEVAPII